MLIDGVDIAKISMPNSVRCAEKRLRWSSSPLLNAAYDRAGQYCVRYGIGRNNAEERREKALDALRQVGLEIMPTATRMNSLAGCVNVWD